MDTILPDDWGLHCPMEPGRGCPYEMVGGKKMPLDANHGPNPFVRMDALPPVLEALRMYDNAAALHTAAASPDVNEASLLGVTALMEASLKGHEVLARTLLQRGCNVHLADATGRTALLYAAQGGNEVIMNLLLAHNADATAAGIDGATPLHYCAQHGLSSACSLLIEHNADASTIDGEGRTAIDVCKYMGHGQLERCLSKASSKPLRLFLLPCLGGFADTEFPRAVWKQLQHAGVVLERVDYPGHGAKTDERPCRTMEGMVEFVWKNYVSQNYTPWAAVGHSMGAIIAYELARRAQQENYPLPTALVLAAAWPPEGYADRAAKLWSWEALEDDAVLVEAMLSIGGIDEHAAKEQELLHHLLPMWRADVAAELNYMHKAEPCLSSDVRVVAVAAESDSTITPEEVQLWGKCINSVKVTQMTGGHFLHRDAQTSENFVSLVGTWLED